ncbi:ATP-dependent DNA helicase RecG [Nesterenkonia halotolerans]|uniref:ATP-dependent DNA helicase RecG n=1 Tax=Nesterenkonia halotolerans TaxID=225325 RepID=A0ABR9J5L5_9MICC|nr:ATP-dependent DNA helicase RecG [Nesterenkonia halotolerans]MBE1513896.1 ATP-dependent DNA helicase RecG [Nesterenkonia halotolerans]
MAVLPTTELHRVLGAESAKTLEQGLGITTAAELLQHYPRRWIEFGHLSSFRDLPEAGEHVSLIAEVTGVSVRKMQNRRGSLAEVWVADDEGNSLKMAFFNGWSVGRTLRAGVRAIFHGKVGSYRDRPTLTNPDFTVLLDTDPLDAPNGPGASKGSEEAVHSGEMVSAAASASDPESAVQAPRVLSRGRTPVPLYPATSSISSFRILDCIEILLDMIDFEDWPEPLPATVRAAEALPDLGEAYRLIHRPETLQDPDRGLHRMRFHEAFLLQGLLHLRRVQDQDRAATPRPRRAGGLLDRFDASLPFTLTAGQRECGDLIAAELDRERPMNRLLQGEVGSGKTLVALRAILQVLETGAQATLIAPTEVLAAQHERSLRRMLGGLADELGLTLLTGSLNTAQRRSALLDIASGTARLVVGTHAVLGEQVHFLDLGLAVVDEQHRFGVEQRDALRHRYELTPHMLVMSATPIPRSVAMTVFGDLELTTLEGLPSGRQPIATHVVRTVQGPRMIGRVWERIAEEVAAGHQVYVVCPKINEADHREDPETGVQTDQDASVELISQRLAEHPLLGETRRAQVHGRMDASAKEEVMTAFERGEIDVLICTTVIEVGVDVHNATVMAILDADAFGVSTLHQLRGRIGRGGAHGLCLLVTRLPDEHPSLERLDQVAEHSDGMTLARLDLERRREGNVLGAAQAGRASTLKLLRTIRDEKIITRAAGLLAELSAADPRWEAYPGLREAVSQYRDVHAGADEFIQRG